MSIPLTINGVTYDYPVVGDTEWGPEATDWASAVTTGMLQKAGGLFQLLAEVDFGTSHGVASLYYKSRTANTASSGQIRLARADVINFRNQANDGNLSLGVSASNVLQFNGADIQSSISVSDTSTIDLTLSGTTLSADIVADSITDSMINSAAAIAYSKLDLADSIVNADINAAAAIAYSKLALSNSIVNADINSSAAIAYSKLNLSASIVNADISNSAAIAYSKLNLSASIVNADVANAAAIAVNKLAALTASRAVVSDGSGFLASATTTATEIGYVNGVTSAIQTQLNARTEKATLTAKGSIYAASAASTPAELTVGANGTVLTANSATATGLEWGTVLTNPMTTGGDIIYGGASGAPQALANGSAGDILTSAGSTNAPAWVSPAYYHGYLTANGGWTTNSTTYANVANGTSPSLTNVVSSGFGTPAIAATNQPGVVLTLPRTTIYYVQASIEASAGSAASFSVRLVDGSGTVIHPGISVTGGAGAYGPTTLFGLYSGTAGATTFKIQGATNTNTLTIGNGQAATTPAVTITVFPVR